MKLKTRLIPNGLMNISEIIGKTIIDIRYKLKSIEGDLDYFESYLTLNSKNTITIPFSGAQQVETVKFKGITKKLSKDVRKLLIGARIIDIIEPYFRNKPDNSEKLFFQLSNNLFITETNIAPSATGAARLYIYEVHEFKNIFVDTQANDFDYQSITGNQINF